MIRAFQVEGYLITTGSMASSLRGAHEQLDCPHCQYPLAIGVSFDESSPDPFHQELSSQREEFTACPNCGEPRIALDHGTTSQGDQILIHKGGFLFRDPRRFEPALFRNPDEPHEVYIKRVIGLPGESVLLREGDVFINGERIVKSLTEQRHLRELIHDENFHGPTDSNKAVPPRWHASRGANPAWTFTPEGHTWQSPAEPPVDPNTFHWLRYQHWTPFGGQHLTTVSLPDEDAEISLPPLPSDQLPDPEVTEPEVTSPTEPEQVDTGNLDLPFQLPRGNSPVRLDEDAHELSVIGVLSEEWFLKLAALNEDHPERVAALAELKARSHLAPLTDYNSYNPQSLQSHAKVVRDLMIACRVQSMGTNGEIAFRIHEGTQYYEVRLNLARSELQLFLKDSPQPVLTWALPDNDFSAGRLIEFSTFDRVLLFAIDGEVLLEGWTLPFHDPKQPYARTPFEIGAAGDTFSLSDLRVYRDLYYRSDFPGFVRNATLEPYPVPADHFFVLGDNSMRSWDSRSWAEPLVSRDQLLGRPLIVHLPSQSAPEEVGGRHFDVRIPDLARIRLIH